MNVLVRLFFILITITSFLSCERQRNTLEQSTIKGDVESITDTIWLADDSYGDIRNLFVDKIMEYYFNRDGFLVSQVSYNYYGDMNSKSTWEYENNNLLNFKNYNSDGELQFVTEYVTEQGKIREETTQFFDVEGNAEFENSFYYYTDNQLDSIISKKDNRKKSRYFSYLDKNGSYTEMVIGYSGKKTVSNNWLDDQKRILKREDSNDTLSYVYDKNGNMVKLVTTNYSNGFKYRYDETGNWIKQIQYEETKDGRHVTKNVVKRHINYR